MTVYLPRLCEYQVFQKAEGKQFSTWQWIGAKGWWHAWGVCTEEGSTDSVAIIEKADGSVITPYPTRMRFLDTNNQTKETDK